MKMLAGSVVMLAASVLAAAALLRTTGPNPDLVPMALGISAVGALSGAALIALGFREGKGG